MVSICITVSFKLLGLLLSISQKHSFVITKKIHQVPTKKKIVEMVKSSWCTTTINRKMTIIKKNAEVTRIPMHCSGILYVRLVKDYR